MLSTVAMRSKRTLIGPRKSRHCQTWLARRFSWNKNLQRKQNWTAKSTNLVGNAGKIKTVFVIGAALWVEWLRHCLGYCRSWKSKLGKFAVAINTGGHSILVFVKLINELCEQFSLGNKNRNWSETAYAWKEPQECMFCSNLIEWFSFSSVFTGNGAERIKVFTVLAAAQIYA